MIKKKIPIGVSDFKTIITDNRYFVDKSLFIKDVIDGPDILLFPRPRRFGKTLNLSMLKYFYNNREDNSKLFRGLNIRKEKRIMQKQGKHPVIYITFKDIKNNTWEACRNALYKIIRELYDDFRYILENDLISEIDKDVYRQILAMTADITDFENSFKLLSKLLYLYYKAKPVILIDEYDTPIHAGFFHHYYDEIIDFMRIFLSSALKDNDYLEKAVLTGILRIAKESLFSGLNNIQVFSLCEKGSADKFGFVENEVADLLHYYDDIFSLSEIKRWYDGYNFAGVEIYNPWSILSSISNKELAVHWVNTSGNDLVRTLCMQADDDVKQDIDIIAQGGKIQKEISDNIVFSDLETNKNALWSFLVHCGYLRYDEIAGHGKVMTIKADLSAPNHELQGLFKEDIVTNWFIQPLKIKVLTKLMTNLISGDVHVFKEEFLQYCGDTLSYYDVSEDEPEKVYHALMIGILMCVADKYYIRSNRESGLGRCDVMLIPKEEYRRDAIYCVRNRGIIFEFKQVNKEKRETFESAIEDAKEQISDKKYSQELLSHGCTEIVNIAVAFAGKELRVEIF